MQHNLGMISGPKRQYAYLNLCCSRLTPLASTFTLSICSTLPVQFPGYYRIKSITTRLSPASVIIRVSAFRLIPMP